MEYLALGTTAIQVPKIGFGTWAYRGGGGVLRRAVELGAGFVDTAESYGTERIVGAEIAPVRDRIFVATKVSPGHFRYADVLRHAAGSLQSLNLASIDLYQLHWPNPQIPLAETMRAMEELVSAGKIRCIGVSNFSVDELKAAQDSLRANPLVSNQVKYSLFDRAIEDDVLPYCQSHGITVIAYSPLERWPGAQIARRVAPVAQQAGKTPAQVLLNWCVAQPGVMAIPKTDRAARVDEACGAVGWSLSPAQRSALEGRG